MSIPPPMVAEYLLDVGSGKGEGTRRRKSRRRIPTANCRGWFLESHPWGKPASAAGTCDAARCRIFVQAAAGPGDRAAGDIHAAAVTVIARPALSAVASRPEVTGVGCALEGRSPLATLSAGSAHGFVLVDLGRAESTRLPPPR